MSDPRGLGSPWISKGVGNLDTNGMCRTRGWSWEQRPLPRVQVKTAGARIKFPGATRPHGLRGLSVQEVGLSALIKALKALGPSDPEIACGGTGIDGPPHSFVSSQAIEVGFVPGPLVS